jgi:undecaprenyl-diphosphatase
MASSHGSRTLWIVAVTLVALYGVLAVVVRIAPDNGIDRSVADWVSRWDVPVLDTTMEWVSWFTDLRPRLVVGFLAVIGLALSGHYRLAALTGAVAAVIAIPVNGLDLFGGIVADRIRPNGARFLAYPSGHTLGTIAQYGFAIYLVFRLDLRRRVLVPIVALLTLPIVLVGPARVLVGVHWSTDVLGAYLLGAATMIGVLLLFGIGDRWLSSRGLLKDSPSRARPQSAAALN